jgi:peptide/nickel transport system substrate-binding protein
MDIAPLRARRDVHLDIHPTMDLYAILFETRDPLLKDERIRQAIAATIDVGGLTRVITQGYSPPNRSIIPSASRFHDQVQAAVPPPNLAEARRLLKAAGYQGQTIRLLTNHRYPAMFNIAVLVQAMARQAGIQIEIDTLDWATQLSHYNAGTYQAMAFGYSARMDASLSLETLIGDKNADTRKVWEDPEARALLERSRLTAEPAERQAIFDQLQALFLQQAPAVSLYNSARIAAVRSNVVGYAGWSAAQQRLWGVGLK